MASLLERLGDAMNSHDPVRVASLVAQDYESSQPAHPARAFGGREQVLANWSAVFQGVPDFTARLIGAAVDGETEWGEWEWHGHHIDGSVFAMRGVVILSVRNGLIARMRLYVEPVDWGEGDIDAAVRDLYRSPMSD
ncbi:ketosteroid isomerase-like protein [Microbacterium sp. BE35]|uniref:nuclear transport factor 2 family protein n=1 Tax=Microbacterium sp. BE35 TaxID=2817773 RepID=UPI0028565329|nr:nuclear transport factor 2 family protein [Microbacterium sp. BE35]MDR7191277.1 ketosteroid isomerase-like protein [Microbacterium sp. BE35]